MRLNPALGVLAGASALLLGAVAPASAAPPATGPAVSTVPVPAGGGVELTAATQIRRVAGCPDTNSYWDVYSSGDTVCLADAGDVDITVPTAYEVTSGNNTGWFTWSNASGQWFKTTLGSKWAAIVFNTVVTVHHVHID